MNRSEAVPSTSGALAVLMAGTSILVLDFFIVNVALPSMQAELGASSSALEWVVAGYGLASAALLITGGRLGDRFGRRRTFTAGIALFTVASAACGAAPSTGVLVGARVVQGAGAALINPNILATIGAAFPAAARTRAIGAYGLVMGLAAAGAQLVGGVIIHADILGLGWRWVFLINLPIGAAALIAAPRYVPESRAGGDERLDPRGTLLVTATLVALVLPLIEGRQHGWPAWAWACLVAAPLLAALTAAHLRRHAHRGGKPVLDPAVFAERHVRAGLLIQLLFWSGQASFFLVLALYLQDGRGLTALGSGAIFSILASAYLVASLRAQRLAARHGGGRVIASGALLLAAGHLALAAALAESHALGLLAPGLLFVGAGMGLGISPLVSTILAGVKPAHAGAVAGVLATTSQLGNAIGVALIGVIFFGALHRGYAPALEASALVLSAVLAAVAAAAWLVLVRAPRRRAAGPETADA